MKRNLPIIKRFEVIFIIAKSMFHFIIKLFCEHKNYHSSKFEILELFCLLDYM